MTTGSTAVTGAGRRAVRWGVPLAVVAALAAVTALAVLLWGAPRPVAAAGGPASCRAGVRCEAEDAELTGTRAEIDGPGRWPGYSGRDFVVGFEHSGTSVTWRVEPVPGAGPGHVLDLRYANNQGQDGRTGPRTLTLTVNGAARTLTFPPTHSWSAWTDLRVPDVALSPAGDVITLGCGAGDSGRVNIDFLAVY